MSTAAQIKRTIRVGKVIKIGSISITVEAIEDGQVRVAVDGAESVRIASPKQYELESQSIGETTPRGE